MGLQIQLELHAHTRAPHARARPQRARSLYPHASRKLVMARAAKGAPDTFFVGAGRRSFCNLCAHAYTRVLQGRARPSPPLHTMSTSRSEQGARALKREGELGCIKPGYLADLLIFDGEPEKVITQLGDQHRFRHIMKDGKLVDLTSPPPKNWELPGWRVSEYSERVLTRQLVDSMGLAR